MGWILGFCAMASLGLPGLAGLLGRVPGDPRRRTTRRTACPSELFRVYMVVAAVGTVFAAGYLLWLLQRTAFGTPEEEWEGHEFHDVELPEWLAWAPLLVLSSPRRLPEPRVRRHRRRRDSSARRRHQLGVGR